MFFLYNQFLRIINFFLPLIGLFSKKVNDFVKGRKSTIEKITINFNDNDNVLWFHSASLGEFEQGSPVISEVKKKFRNHKILLTFFSPSGYNTQKNYSNADLITYLPIDSLKNVKEFLDCFRPKLVILIKYEFWPNYLAELN